jgi:hypothetical protein
MATVVLSPRDGKDTNAALFIFDGTKRDNNDPEIWPRAISERAEQILRFLGLNALDGWREDAPDDFRPR